MAVDVRFGLREASGDTMRLLVSVRTAEEALAALAGGADIIDGKDPSAGPLGALALAEIRSIVDAVEGRTLVTAALGDATSEDAVARLAGEAIASGAALVKIGFAGCAPERVDRLLSAAASECGGERVIAVAYADAHRVSAPAPAAILAAATRSGAAGVLLDTGDKEGPSLRELLSDGDLSAWVSEVRAAKLVATLAGRLRPDDLSRLAACGPDVVGVRGAACDGGRTGAISTDAVRRLRALCRQSELPEDPVAISAGDEPRVSAGSISAAR